jgi:hypothetical protein
MGSKRLVLNSLPVMGAGTDEELNSPLVPNNWGCQDNLLSFEPTADQGDHPNPLLIHKRSRPNHTHCL